LTTKGLPLRAVVFDFDGTLAKLNIDFSRMRQEVLDLIAACGISRLPDNFRDLPVLELIAAGAVLASQRKTGGKSAFLTQAYASISGVEIEAAQRGALFHGTRELLRSLHRQGVKTGVITRNCLAAVQTLFPDIDGYVQTVITREQTPRVKPDPGHLMMALDRLNIEVEQAAMVGDHPLDIQTGRAAGVFTIGVLTGYSGREALERAGADLILSAAADIPALLI
jgi:phosphoglycolate phosphatase